MAERVSEDASAELARLRLRSWCINAGMTDDQATDLIDSLGATVWLLASVLARNEDDAPNFFTVAMRSEDPPGAWELTVRRHDGQTPATRIAALEAKRERLRAVVEAARKRRKCAEWLRIETERLARMRADGSVARGGGASTLDAIDGWERRLRAAIEVEGAALDALDSDEPPATPAPEATPAAPEDRGTWASPPPGHVLILDESGTRHLVPRDPRVEALIAEAAASAALGGERG